MRERNVLVVDDDPVSNFITEKTLAKLGIDWAVRAAVNGEEALQIIRERFERGLAFPSIILLDLNMPIMDGFGFIEEFRKLNFSSLSETKIIIVTSSEDRRDILRAESLGIKDYVVKPLLEADVLRLFARDRDINVVR